jgi:hypothetical protein
VFEVYPKYFAHPTNGPKYKYSTQPFPTKNRLMQILSLPKDPRKTTFRPWSPKLHPKTID